MLQPVKALLVRRKGSKDGAQTVPEAPTNTGSSGHLKDYTNPAETLKAEENAPLPGRRQPA